MAFILPPPGLPGPDPETLFLRAKISESRAVQFLTRATDLLEFAKLQEREWDVIIMAEIDAADVIADLAVLRSDAASAAWGALGEFYL
eukprot:10870958-Heterocapsa_arctica.AAC.1